MESWEIEFFMIVIILGMCIAFGWMVGVAQYKKQHMTIYVLTKTGFGDSYGTVINYYQSIESAVLQMHQKAKEHNELAQQLFESETDKDEIDEQYLKQDLVHFDPENNSYNGSDYAFEVKTVNVLQ